MKATELMIGDWVYFYHNEDGIAPYDEPIQWSKEDYEYTDDFIETTFEPIPLTKEMLRKNEWNKCGSAYSNDSIPFELEDYPDGSFGIRVLADECGYGTFACIAYVHELQHCLRLCGINKDIQL